MINNFSSVNTLTIALNRIKEIPPEQFRYRNFGRIQEQDKSGIVNNYHLWFPEDFKMWEFEGKRTLIRIGQIVHPISDITLLANFHQVNCSVITTLIYGNDFIENGQTLIKNSVHNDLQGVIEVWEQMIEILKN